MVLGKKAPHRENRKCNDYKESIDLHLAVSEGEIRGAATESRGGGFISDRVRKQAHEFVKEYGGP